MDLLRYLDTTFFTRNQLLAACGIDAAELAALQERAVMPGPSYRLRLDIACDSFFGAHAEQVHADYYAKGYACWIGTVRALASDHEAFDVFARRCRARVAQLAAAGVRSNHPRFNAGLDQHLLDIWQHFLKGTFGVCTRSGLPEDIADKEVAVAIIEEIVGDGGEQALTDAVLEGLRRAVDLLDAASAPFAPHEVERSSRHRLVDQARERYRLQAQEPSACSIRATSCLSSGVTLLG